MKKVVFGIFVVSMFALASCGGSQNEQQQALDSLNKALDQAVQELNSQVDSLNATMDTTAQQ
jgi:outer membrane murein-binding lipoprotein Lpp